MKTRILALTLVFLIFFLTACNDIQPPPPDPEGKEKIELRADMNGDGIKDSVTAYLFVPGATPEHEAPVPVPDRASYLEAVIKNQVHRISMGDINIDAYDEIEIFRGENHKEIPIITIWTGKLCSVLAITFNEDRGELELLPVPTVKSAADIEYMGYAAEIRLLNNYVFELVCVETGYTEKCSFAGWGGDFATLGYDADGNLNGERKADLEAVNDVSVLMHEENCRIQITQVILDGLMPLGYFETIFCWDETNNIRVVDQKVKKIYEE